MTPPTFLRCGTNRSHQQWRVMRRGRRAGVGAGTVPQLDARTGRHAVFTPGVGRAAKQVCRGRPAMVECLRIGEKFPLGVFGGASPDERHTQR